MRNIFALFKRETFSFFVSPIAYFVITGFALLSGYFFFNLLQFYNVVLAQSGGMQMPGQELPNLNQWVLENFYHTLLVILVFLVPMITMRVFSEDKRRGTFELLVTSPLSIFQIVIGKYLSVLLIMFLLTVVAASFPLLLAAYGRPGPEILPLLSGALGVFLASAAFASIGIALSACTENQIVAGVSALVALLLLYVIHSPAESIGGTVGAVLNYISPVKEVDDLFRGVITLSSIVYFLSVIFLGLFLSQRALDAYRWR